MQKLRISEQKKVIGGAATGWIVAGIITGISFLVGIFDGYTRPFKCR